MNFWRNAFNVFVYSSSLVCFRNVWQADVVLIKPIKLSIVVSNSRSIVNRCKVDWYGKSGEIDW